MPKYTCDSGVHLMLVAHADSLGFYRNQTTGEGSKRPLVWAKGASSIERKCVESPPMFIRGKRQKNQKDDGLRILKMRVRELFSRTGKVLAPHVRPSQGTTAATRVCKYDFKTMYFPFLCFYVFFPFLIFFILFCFL